MSLSEFQKCILMNESNIPVPKRIQPGNAKKKKGRSDLPELQKYIESIISERNDYQSDVLSFTGSKEKSSKQRRVGKHSVYKESEIPFKLYDLNITTPKPKPTETKDTSLEVVNNREEIVSKVEDKEKRRTAATKLNPVDFEKFLKKMYPNPYDLQELTEFKNIKTDPSSENIERIACNVPISKPVSTTEVGSQTTESVSITEINTNIFQEQNGVQHPMSNCSFPVSQKDKYPTGSEDERSSKGSDASVLKKIPALIRTVSRNRDISSTSSSRQSSVESMSSSGPRFKNKTSGMMEPANNIKSRISKKLLKYDANNINDYDIGKLQLLSMTDSDDSSSGIKVKNQGKNLTKKDFQSIDEGDEFKAKDISDMREIYDVMHKATESVLILSLQSEKEQNSRLKRSFSNIPETGELVSFLSDTTDITKSKNPGFIRSESESHVNMKNKDQSRPAVSNEKLDEQKTGGNREVIEKNSVRKLEKVERKPQQIPKEHCSRPKDDTKRRTVSLVNLGKETEEKQNLENEDLRETSQKIDEVLQFMYDCLINFTDKGKLGEEEKSQERKKIPDTNIPHLNSAQRPVASNLPKANSYPCARGTDKGLDNHRSPLVKEMQTESSQDVRRSGETSRRPASRVRCRRRLENYTRTERKLYKLLPTSNRSPSVSNPDIQNSVYMDSIEIRDQNAFQTVEGQNELGGFTEEQQDQALVASGDLRFTKTILPLSVKIKKSNTDTCEALKNALETEEKLMAGDKKNASKEVSKKPKNVLCRNTANQFFGRSGVAPWLGRPNSNFVICLNALPRNMRTLANNRTKMCFSSSLSISLGDIRKPRNVKPIKYTQTSTLERLAIGPKNSQKPSNLSYMFKEHILVILKRTRVSHVATPVCLSVTKNRTIVEVCSLEESQASVEFKIQEPKTDNSEVVTECEEKPVEALEVAVERTEESVFLLEKNNEPAKNLYEKCESLSCSSTSEIVRNENSENEWEGENEKKKVHDLLLRTYNLQRKLHSYLQKMTCVQPSSLSCPLIHQETYLDISVLCKEPATQTASPLKELDLRAEQSPLVYWYLQSPEMQSKEVIRKIDHSTSYHPPSEEDSPAKPIEEEEEEKPENDDDDRSSTYSFKSSNDFSDSNEMPPLEKEPKPETESKNTKFLKKIFNDIESFKKSLREKDEENNENSGCKVDENDSMELVEYKGDTKTPAKVLKTVFKGKESSTELSIGLKDIPMTNISNISVEKTKYSSNHTKISICISKEKGENRKNTRQARQHGDLLQNKLSSFYLDDFRPSLSTCQTQYSRLDDNISKSSGSYNEETDDEDDYKSVMSTLSNQEGEAVKEVKPTEKKTLEVPSKKTYHEHRFDFYRKMDSNYNLGEKEKQRERMPSTVCRYKELEPLRQALTEMQIRMRSIKRDSYVNGNEYYDRALKLAKMSAGYCQSCGTRSVIPEDTFGYYRNLLPRRYSHHHHHHHHHHRNHHFNTSTPQSSFYSFRSSNAELSDHLCDLDLNLSSSYILKPSSHSTGRLLRSSFHEFPILLGRM